jgi:hypothetical protein
MISRTYKLFTAMAFFAALAISVQVPAHDSAIQIKTLDDPHAGTVSGQGTQASSINPLGLIGGCYGDDNGVYGFVSKPPYTKGTFTTIADPSAVFTCIYSSNLEGTVSGGYIDGSNVIHGFVSRPPYTTLTTIDVPGAGSGSPCPQGDQGTYAFNISDVGTIAGNYVDSGCVSHGFVSKPPYTATDTTTLDATGACSSGADCFGLGTSLPSFVGLNQLGVIAGQYLDESGISHGFVITPPYT